MNRAMDSFALEGVKHEPTMRDRLVFLLRGAGVKRFHTAKVIQENTVAHHSCLVAWFIVLLSDEQPRAELLLAALAHDKAEQITSDVSAPAKRLLGIRKLLREKENEVLGRFGFEYEYLLTPDEERTLGLADAMDGMLFCISERMLGNRFIEYTFQKFHSYISNAVTTPKEQAVMSALTSLWEDAIDGNFNEGN